MHQNVSFLQAYSVKDSGIDNYLLIFNAMSLSKYSEKVLTPDVGSKPHQPLMNFKFPYREFGKQKTVKHTFQYSWFSKWKRLHYEEDTDKAFCYNCIKACKEDKLRTPNLELAFISQGFNNWKDASVKFKEHESSNCHKDSVVVTVGLPSSVKDIVETLQSELTKQKMENRKMLLKILSNIRFLYVSNISFLSCIRFLEFGTIIAESRTQRKLFIHLSLTL